MKNAKTKDIFESDQAATDENDEKRKTTYMYILFESDQASYY